MCACANKWENFWEKWSNKGETWDLFDFWKNLLRTGLWECTSGRQRLCMGSVCFVFGSWFFLAFPPLLAWLRRALPLSLRSHVCVWSIASSRCPCIRESISVWSSDLFLILSSFCHLFNFFIFFVLLCFCFSLGSFVVCWQCTHQGGDWGMLSTLSWLWWVNCQPCGVIVCLVFGCRYTGVECRWRAVVAAPPKLIRLKCANHHQNDNQG